MSGCKNQDHISAFSEIGNRTEADVSPELSSGAQTQHAMALAQSEYVALQLTPFCVAIKLYSDACWKRTILYDTKCLMVDTHSSIDVRLQNADISKPFILIFETRPDWIPH